VYSDTEPLDCPVFVTGGTQDVIAGETHLAAWREQTTGPFFLRMFEGNHFFFEQYKNDFLHTFSTNLKSR
jgi:surfactin synthase thioesterase subunit